MSPERSGLLPFPEAVQRIGAEWFAPKKFAREEF
jgi:hypothetical protein